jgi:site-specific recombinase XerD
MKLTKVADFYLEDMKRMGRITSRHTEASYRFKLQWLAEVAGNRDPKLIGRQDIKNYLARWSGNSQLQAHAIATSFFGWCVEEGYVKANVAQQVRRAKSSKPQVYRMTREEVLAFLEASNTRRRDRWVAHLGCCAGLRSQEIRGLQGRHFARPGWIWVSADIGKGQKQRWIPVLSDLEPVVEEILTLVGIEEFVIPGRRIVDPPWNTKVIEDPTKPVSASGLFKQVLAIGERAGIAGRITPHVMRHSFAQQMTRIAGVHVTQTILGHADIGTTQGYLGDPTLEELAANVRGFSWGTRTERSTEDVMPLSTQIQAETPDGKPNAS